MIKFKWIICNCCNGEGSVENPAFDNGFISSEWADMHTDEQAAYMAGDYNVPCQECNSSGKVQIADIAAMTFGEKRKYILEQREEVENRQLDREISQEVAAERAFGC